MNYLSLVEVMEVLVAQGNNMDILAQYPTPIALALLGLAILVAYMIYLIFFY
jgi:hypothetical protein